MSDERMTLFPELPARQFKPILSFATKEDRDSFVAALARASTQVGQAFDGIEVRTHPFVPKGKAVLNSPAGYVLIEWDDQ